MISGISYLLPLTSKTTQDREKEGRKKRAAKVTTFVRNSDGTEIANILHNNMIPVVEGCYTEKEIDASVDTYESNEIRFIRKHRDSIISKAHKVHDKRIEGKDVFLKKVCCDFKKLEEKYAKYNHSE
jgi:protein AbiQ